MTTIGQHAEQLQQKMQVHDIHLLHNILRKSVKSVESDEKFAVIYEENHRLTGTVKKTLAEAHECKLKTGGTVYCL